MSFTITEQCTGCMACAAVCPTGAIRGEQRRRHEIDPLKCIECGACGVACRDDAVFDHHGALFSLGASPSRALAQVDVARCTGCGWCAAVCAFDAIAPRARHAHGSVVARVAEVDRARCLACGACEVECTAGAVRVLRPGDPKLLELRPRNPHALKVSTEPSGISPAPESV